MTKKEIGQFVLDKRNELNLSQSKLADKIGMRRQAIFEIETDRVDFRLTVLLDILGALGYQLSISPIGEETFAYDFSKISAPEIEPQTFTKKKKTNEKSNRRTGGKK
jgi:DNA-binding XRE family transcriptional regulator